MLYQEYIQKAKNICVAVDDVNNTAYLLPDYRYILYLSGLKIEDVSDFPGVNMDIVCENLKLEADAYNARNNMTPAISSWIRETILDVFSPIESAEQDELMKNIIEYLRVAADKREAEAKKLEAKARIQQPSNEAIMNISNLIDFTKK